MNGRYFISYSRLEEGSGFTLRLADELESGPPTYKVWVDVRDMQPGEDWEPQLVEAIRACEAILFVMTEDSVLDESGCKLELVRGLRYKKPVIPLRLSAAAELPFRLGSRQYVDFSDGFEPGLARLRKHLAWTATAAGVLQELRNRRADAEYELPRADPAQRQRIVDEIAQLDRRIEEQQRDVDHPTAAAERTDKRIQAAIAREQQPERPAAAAPRARFVNPPPIMAPSYFQDRHVETELIGEFLRDGGMRLLSVVGRGGVGKTAMVCRLLKALEGGRLPDDLGELPVDGIVYLSPLGAHPINFPNLFSDLCRLLPQATADTLLARYRDPHETPVSLTRALLEQFPAAGRWCCSTTSRTSWPTTGLTDEALDDALGTVLAAPAHGVKVIVTTRLAPQRLMLTQPAVQDRIDLDEGLPSPHAEAILRARDPSGRLGLKDAPDALLAQARERTRGFPRALEALAGILAADRSSTLPELLAATEQMPQNVIEALVGEAFSRLDPLAQQVMEALAIYPSPVPPVAVDYLLQPFQPAIDSAPVLARLVNMQFVRRDGGGHYLHQVDRDYAVRRFPDGEPGDRHIDPPPFSRYALLARAAGYFEQTRTPRDEWRSLDDLAPQLAEFELRCQAGDHEAAADVLVDVSGEYLQVWGHVRLALGLHERLHGRLTDPWRNASNLLSLGGGYIVLGQTPRAIEFFEQALAIYREVGERTGEATALNSLGSGRLALGDARSAIEHYEQALAIYREVGNRIGEANALNSIGTGYNALGEAREAIGYFEQALDIYREAGIPTGEANAVYSLGNGYIALGEVRRAIGYYEQALEVYRETRDRGGQATALNSLGSGYADLGQLRRAIGFYDEALDIYREIGDRGGEGNALNSLGNGHLGLGDAPRAIEYYEQALAIYREIGHRMYEGAPVTNMGLSYAALGDPQRAIALHEEALVIYREVGRRDAEASTLIALAEAHTDASAIQPAIRYARQAAEIADDIGFASGSSDARLALGTALLFAGEADEARTMAEDALGYENAPMRDNIELLRGIALARAGKRDEARQAFLEALGAADTLLAQKAGGYDELDSRALALCGLAVVESPARASEAIETFRAARAIAGHDGIVGRVLRLIDTLAFDDATGVLASVRPAAAGKADRPVGAT